MHAMDARTDGKPDRDAALAASIREILLTDWDPANAGRFEAARGEYDGYIEPLRDLIQSGADEEAIVSYLHEREQETMCFPSLGTRRLVPVARKLLGLRDT
jgi:hypothetical protein